jgi:amidohydrolase
MVSGRGGHGARPHTTLDPIASATQLVQAIYAQLPRSLNAQDPLVVSFGVIQGGINPNVIPESVQLRGTIRSFDADLSRMAKRRIREIADGLAQANSVNIDFRIAYSLPGVLNDAAVTACAVEAIDAIIGPANRVAVSRPSLGGEDFARYLDHAPGCMLRLGVATPLKPQRHLHSTGFDIDERALPVGAMVLAQTALTLALHHC